MASAGGATGSPCGACKFLRRKCAPDCVFAPYFCSEQGPARFSAIHKVFGASNVSKLLLHLPLHHRCEAVFTLAYEAQARIRDPVYGSVSHIFALQQQVAYLQGQLMQAKAQLSSGLIINNSRSNTDQSHLLEGNHNGNNFFTNYQQGNHTISPESSLGSIEQAGNFAVKVEQEKSNVHDLEREYYQMFMQHYQPCGRKRLHEDEIDVSELQELALRMTRN